MNDSHYSKDLGSPYHFAFCILRCGEASPQP